jgi:hypothetical protein
VRHQGMPEVHPRAVGEDHRNLLRGETQMILALQAGVLKPVVHSMG